MTLCTCGMTILAICCLSAAGMGIARIIGRHTRREVWEKVNKWLWERE